MNSPSIRANSDFVCYNRVSNTDKGDLKMSFDIHMSINNQQVSVIFDWSGKDEDGGPDWDTMKVIALLPTPTDPFNKYWAVVNDLLSYDDWKNIELEIYANWKELERQAYEQDY